MIAKFNLCELKEISPVHTDGVSGKRRDPGMSRTKLKAFAERASGNFLRLKPQAAELK